AGVKIWQRPPWPPDTGVEEKELYGILGVLGKFRVWEDDCEFVPFYEDDKALGVSPECVITGSYRRKGKVLALFGNLSGETVKFDLEPNRMKLRLSGNAKPMDAETGTPLVGGKVEIAPYDVRLVVME
ncbi:MAG: hypothetical protein IKK82_11050, partial [Kiritimatiellae bacterium]|nr:hypothetical protein [Kiritimatiellia bacterium]